MTFIVADRVQETTNSPGTGTATLLGAVSGYQSFSTGIGANNTTYYTIADQTGTNWEVGLGALNSTGTVLTRTTVYSSSNGGSTVNFATGTQYVWCDYPSSKAVIQGTAVNFSSIGATTAGTGAFTTLSASSTVSGAGFSNYFAAPPTIGNTTPNAGTFTALVATSITDSGLTSGRVNYATTGGLLTDSANMTFSGTALTLANDASISSLNVGKGGGAVSSNTAIGVSALQANTTGSNNTASGASALFSNTTGSNNTASGVSALYYNTTGAQNTASGVAALYSNNTGSNNTASGLQALYSNTTGSNNTANGWNALYYNTTGSSNAAFGNSALTSNTTASYNSAFSYGSLAANTTGANNTAIGFQSLAGNTTASNNTAVGYQAGYSNTTGAGNTFVGYTAGTAVTSGSNLTVIGNTAAASSATATNEVTIGNSSVIVTRLGGTTVVASLPSAATVGAGARAFVTNASAPAFGATVAGGGAVPVPVYSDGTNWKVG